MTTKNVFLFIVYFAIIIALVLVLNSVVTKINEKDNVNVNVYYMDDDKKIILEDIRKTDSIINNHKSKLEYDESKINNLDDSSSIKLFHKLINGK